MNASDLEDKETAGCDAPGNENLFSKNRKFARKTETTSKFLRSTRLCGRCFYKTKGLSVQIRN